LIQAETEVNIKARFLMSKGHKDEVYATAAKMYKHIQIMLNNATKKIEVLKTMRFD
jgi:hypothetical protein